MARQLIVELVGKTDKFQKSMTTAASEADGFADKLKAASKKMQDAGKKMTTFVTLPIVGAGAAAFKMASDLNESLNAVDVAFKKDAKEVQAWAKNLNSAFGLTNRQALDAASNFRLVTQNTTITGKQITDLAERAADLGSVFNATAEDVSSAVKSALVGETEPMRRFGVVINETRLKAEALALGLVKGSVDMEKVASRQIALTSAQQAYNRAVTEHGPGSEQAALAMQKVELASLKLEGAMKGGKIELDAAQKAAASYSLIMKDTSFAQGDATNTADSAAGKMRILKTEFADTATEIGLKLLPVGEKLLGWLGGLLEKFDGLSPKTQDIIIKAGLLTAALGPLVYVLGTLGTVLTFISANPIVLAIAAFAAMAAATVILYRENEKFAAVIDHSFNIAKDAVVTAWRVIEPILRLMKDNFDRLAGPLSSFLGAAGKVGGAVGGLVGKLPGFHDGGVVPGAPGAPQLVVAHGGERFLGVGAGALQGGGTTVVVNVSGVGMGRDFGQAVADALRDNGLIGVG